MTKKKILFLQIKGNSLGGIWFVNKTLGEAFLNKNYEVKVLAIRNNHPGMKSMDTTLNIEVINENDNWEIIRKKELIKSLLKFKFFRTLKRYILEHSKLKKDIKLMGEKIKSFDPDYIIASHYHTLLAIPKKYLKKTINVQHSSFEYVLKDRYNVKILKKFQNKIYKLCWLSKTIMNQAQNYGFSNNTYIYNPCRFESNKSVDVVKNKKISVITRIHKEKRIDLMVKMVNDVFEKYKINDWIFEIYGVGTFNNESVEIMKNNKNIIYKGETSNPKSILENSSFSLNTSLYEGFSLSILEAFACGLPVITFNYGKNVNEQVINGYNGFVIEKDNINEFEDKLHLLLSNNNELKKLSINAKEFSNKFKVDKIIQDWEKLFRKID